tara:strand:+ start:115 stop:348 length:234 start_codon:yes stop_codon:yes gene_type:complete
MRKLKFLATIACGILLLNFGGDNFNSSDINTQEEAIPYCWCIYNGQLYKNSAMEYDKYGNALGCNLYCNEGPGGPGL